MNLLTCLNPSYTPVGYIVKRARGWGVMLWNLLLILFYLFMGYSIFFQLFMTTSTIAHTILGCLVSDRPFINGSFQKVVP